MKIIISPAKKMNIDTDSFNIHSLPIFMEETKLLCSTIQKMNYKEVKALWKCNDKLAELNFKRFTDMDLEKNLTPAILSYEGLQYQHMSPMVFSKTALSYVEEHLRILSGFYGVLTPLNGVVPYRLEMQAKLSAAGKKNLYDFWGDRLYKAIIDEDHLIINLASKEYSAAVEKYLASDDRFVTIKFGELQDGKIKQKGTFAKMARGEMVRFMAENSIKDLEGIKEFNSLGYHYAESYSTEKELVFLY